MTTFSGLISDLVDEMLGEGTFTVHDVRGKLSERHGSAMIAEQERLADIGITRLIKQCLRKAADDDGLDNNDPSQLNLPGFKEPKAIAVPIGESGDYEYVAYNKAQLPQVQAGLAERDMNIYRASRRREDYLMKLDFLRPLMQDRPGITVEEALKVAVHA